MAYLIALLPVVLGCLYVPVAAAEPSRLQVAEAMLVARCKKSGEFIHRAADNVEGIFLMKLRPKEINFGDQFKLDDPYGADVTGNGYIAIFLQGKDAKGSLVEHGGVTSGYGYVEAIDPRDNNRYRYTGSINEITHTTSILMGGDGRTIFKTKDFVLEKVLAPGSAPPATASPTTTFPPAKNVTTGSPGVRCA